MVATLVGAGMSVVDTFVDVGVVVGVAAANVGAGNSIYSWFNVEGGGIAIERLTIM